MSLLYHCLHFLLTCRVSKVWLLENFPVKPLLFIFDWEIIVIRLVGSCSSSSSSSRHPNPSVTVQRLTIVMVNLWWLYRGTASSDCTPGCKLHCTATPPPTWPRLSPQASGECFLSGRGRGCVRHDMLSSVRGAKQIRLLFFRPRLAGQQSVNLPVIVTILACVLIVYTLNWVVFQFMSPI